MKRYVLFLRGINISGKNKVNMAELKAALEAVGFVDVATYLNSGNILLSSDEAPSVIRAAAEKVTADRLGVDVPVCVIEQRSLQDILNSAPVWWGTEDKNRYDNLIFILTDDTPDTLCSLIGEPSEELEQIQPMGEVIFWTFDRKAYQKCRWWKRTAAAGIAEKLTIRTAGTIRKMAAPGKGKNSQ